jgi:hypothetical protein
MSKQMKIGILTIVFVVLISLMSFVLPPAVDWHGAFRPAIIEILHGRSPYTVDGFYHAPWGLIPLIPLALFPESIGRALLVMLGLVSYTFVAHRLGAKSLATFFFLISPPVVHVLQNGNLDWMAAIGFVLPPQIGLFFISVKPQMGIAVAPFWLIETYRQGGWTHLLKTFTPFLLALLISFALFGFWPLASIQQTANIRWNASLWPMSIPVGLALFVASIRKRKIEYAMAASPCLSPYVLFHSWAGVLLAFVSSLPETIAAVIGLWILVAIRYFS